ncbi:hypothetical protein DBR43_17090 [Pedobacter sp. KBW06]|uniref:PIN domain-containing protein n=1 Tax=Pedobacter sp. KBW06 TaxID=2153359 RepID=UPI000F59889D|nr:hypothetical protein [Pedobacter sp. KBW06]RQO69774.1 hypothetical protein DBR43_17090 [Pedobacter sp. KBW06]
MLLTTIFAGLASFLPEALAGYFLGKGMDKFLNSDTYLKDELQDVIQETITEYAEADARNYGRKLPFYHSVGILEGLLKFRVMSPGDYDISLLLLAMENEPDIVLPTAVELDTFYSLFMNKIAQSESLRKLEIKEGYSQEVYNVSQMIRELTARIDNLAQLYTGDLEVQWKDRVDTYVKTLQDFKPATALKLLESLENSLQTSSKRPEPPFMAFLEFQKGQCLGFLGRTNDMHKAKLKAYGMQPSNILYAQSAAICLYRMKDTAELNKVIAEIFALEAYNPVGWAIKTLTVAAQDFNRSFEAVPIFVRNDITFRRVLYNEADQELEATLEDDNLLPSCLNYQEKELTIDGYNEAIFWINAALKEIFRVYFVNYYENNQVHRAEMTKLNVMLSRLLEKVSGSELAGNFERMEFLLIFTQFSLSGDQQKAEELEAFYQRMSDKQEIFAIQTANALQLSSLEERAINVLESKPELSPEALLLLLFTYQKKDDMSGYCGASKRFAKSIQVFENKYLILYLNLIVELSLHGQIGNFVKEDFLADKTFGNAEDEKMVNAVVALIFGDRDLKANTYLEHVALTSDDAVLVDLLGSVFFAAEVYESALNILARNLEGKSAGRTLYQYIHAHSKTGKDYKELLSLLENWRLNLPFSSQFCRLEAQLRQELVEWKTVAEIGRYYLENIPEDSAMLASYVHALHLLNNAESILEISRVPERAKLVEFRRPEELISVCQILFLHGMQQEAFELLYPQALYPNAIKVRGAYTNLVLQRNDVLPFFIEYDVVERGHFVKYVREGITHYTELDDQALSHPVYKLFLGKAKDEAITVPRKLVNIIDTFTIKRIMNKYLALFDEILNQSKEDPHAGLPFTTLDFNEFGPDGFIGMMQSMFGERNQITKQTSDAQFNAYYDGSLSLSELVSIQYDQNYVLGYYSLVRYHKGISTVKQHAFNQHTLSEDNRIVIDYSSLLMLYQISLFHQYDFKQKFILSRYIAERIKFELSTIQYKADRFGAAGPDLGRTAINDNSFDFLKDQETYLQGLIAWIDQHCEVELSDNTIEFIKKAGVTVGENEVLDAAMSTFLLVTDNDNRVLVTDDSFSIRMSLLPLNRLVSMEHYLKSMHTLKTTVLDELVRNRYIRYSPTAGQLDVEYVKKIAGQYSHYSLIIEGLSLVNSRINLDTAIKHMKDIALKPVLTNEQVVAALSVVFVNILKECTSTVVELVGQKTYLDFALLGGRQDDVALAFEDARQIIFGIHNYES